MKGAVIEKVGAQPVVVDDLERPKPGPNQVLVKSLWTSMNPVDGFMAMTGMLVLEWPLVIGVDASGVVVEAGAEAESKYGLKVGSHVCGCTRLGMKHFATGQEYYLMDAPVTIPKPKNINLAQAATLGVGVETAALGVFQGLKFPVIDPTKETVPKDEWAIVLGGGSSVGGYAVQILKAAGYKVLASCSGRSAGTVKALGAEAFDYKVPIEEQVNAVIGITGGKIAGIFDAAASSDPAIAKKLFSHPDWKSSNKLFATTNDWSGVGNFEGGSTYEIKLGPVGRPDSVGLNAALESYIPMLVRLVEDGKIKTGEYEAIGKGGFESVIEAYKLKSGGAGGQKKLVVQIQEE